jgi:hypothetical protein
LGVERVGEAVLIHLGVKSISVLMNLLDRRQNLKRNRAIVQYSRKRCTLVGISNE